MNLEMEGQDISVLHSALIERARKALTPINRSFTMNLGRHGTLLYVACALVSSESNGSLTLDFKAHVPGEIGQAFIGPQVPLTETLFNGDGFTPSFLKELEDSFKEFDAYAAEANE